MSVHGSPPGAGGDTLAVSVHGPGGVVDLVVPAGTTGLDLAREYAREARLSTLPYLYGATGAPLPADAPVVSVGLESGDLVVATPALPPAHRATPAVPTAPGPESEGRAGAVATVVLVLAAAAAVLAGVWAGAAAPGPLGDVVVPALLGLGALLAVVPAGPRAPRRALTAPALAAAAVLALAWAPGPDRLPGVVALAALGAAATAAVARVWWGARPPARGAVDPLPGLAVWLAAGGLVLAVTGVGAALALRPSAVWAVLLAVAVLAARLAPSLAVGVPDRVLLDLDRLAVTAWSARDDRARGRSRAVVDEDGVRAVALRGGRLVTAVAAATAVVAPLAAALLLATATVDLDRIGARVEVLLAGAALLLVARGHRHRGARVLLRLAGLACWAALVVAALPLLPERGPGAVVAWVLPVAVGGACALAAATSRVGAAPAWARRAELLEALTTAGALAAVVVASGLFRALWETTS